MQTVILNKEQLKRDLATALADDISVEKVVVFGSFISSDEPHDMDIAVFCNSTADYLTLALAYRRKLREIARIIPLDVLPIPLPCDSDSLFFREINKGEIIYEKRH
jgi:predicted nucleotidyltransferase